MGLDINTRRGKTFMERQRKLEHRLSHLLGYKFVSTPIKKGGIVDGFLYSEDSNELEAVYEIKCRDSTLEEFKTWGSYLITSSKLDGLISLSKDLKVPSYLFVETSDKSIIIFTLTNNLGKAIIPIPTQLTTTQATVNGGFAKRLNAYLSMEYAQILK